MNNNKDKQRVIPFHENVVEHYANLEVKDRVQNIGKNFHEQASSSWKILDFSASERVREF
jgi:hypothetical protein